MSKVCSLCGKRPVAGQNVSHSKRRTKRRFLPNLVSKKFGGVKVWICTSCLRTLKKPERIKQLAESVVKKIEEVKVESRAKDEKERTSSAEK